MEQWNLEHRIFAYDCFVRSGESVIAVQREFRRRFNVHRNETIPSRNTILRWVTNFRTEGCIMKKKTLVLNGQCVPQKMLKESGKQWCKVQHGLLEDIQLLLE